MVLEFLNRKWVCQTFSNDVFKAALSALEDKEEALEITDDVIGLVNEKFSFISDDEQIRQTITCLTRKAIADRKRKRQTIFSNFKKL